MGGIETPTFSLDLANNRFQGSSPTGPTVTCKLHSQLPAGGLPGTIALTAPHMFIASRWGRVTELAICHSWTPHMGRAPDALACELSAERHRRTSGEKDIKTVRRPVEHPKSPHVGPPA
jgi:hypothetical protein